MPIPKPLIVRERPVCDYERPVRCRKTAEVSIDGVYRCRDHRNDEYSIQFAAFARPIFWQRDR